jgi:polysaccharide export outer membrane protein
MTLGALCVAAPARAATDADSTGIDYSKVPEYRIVPADELELNFGPRLENVSADLIRKVTVRPDGRISVFPVGDVIAAGRTPMELQLALESLLSADLRQPRVVVEVTKLAGNQIHVFGQVRKPGSYPADPYLTLAQAIAAAGGFEDGAQRDQVLVVRRDGARNARVMRIPLGRAIKRGTFEADIRLSRFDIVYVPRSTISNIDVFIRQVVSGPGLALQTALIGWELFNLDRVFVGTTIRSTSD